MTVTPVFIDLLGFFFLCLVPIVSTFSINVQSPLIHLPWPSKLQAMAIFTIHSSHRMMLHLMYYHATEYIADSTIVFHGQYRHNIPTALLTIQYAYARLLSSCCMVTPRVCGYGSRVASRYEFFLSWGLVWLFVTVSFKFSIQIEPHVILLWCAAGPSSIAFLSFHKPNTSFDSGQQIYISRCAPHAYLLLEGLGFQNNNCESSSFFFFLATLSRIARGT